MSLFQNGKKFEDYIPYGKIKKIFKEVYGAFSIIEPSKYNEIMVAVKIPEKINNKRKKNLSIDEIRKHDYFYCKYVINFRGITVLPNETANCLIMDYAENGNLHEYLSKHSLEQDIKLKMAINIAEGLFECHRHVHKIIHLNINSENILVDKNLELKVGGFGYDANGDLDDKETVRWAAPERFSEDPAMKKHYKENPELSDIYSYGLVLLEIAMNGVEPYRDMEINEIKEAKKGAEISINISDLNIPGSLEKIIKECCNSSPSERPALADIVLRLKNLHYKNSMENLEDDPEKLTKFYFAEEKYEFLVQHLSKLLEANERNVFMLKYRGAAYYFLKEYEKSDFDLTEAHFLEPNDPFTLKFLGAISREKQLYEFSRDRLTESLNIEPNDIFALRERGAVYYSLNKYEESLADLDKILTIDSKNIFAINYLRKINLTRKEMLVDVVDDKKFAQSLRQHGESHFMIGKYNESFAYFNTSLDIEPENVSALSHRGAIYRLFFKKIEKALEDLDKALEIDPNYEFALSERDKTYQAMNEINQSTAENKALKIHEKWHSIVGKELPLIEPQHYVKLGIVISPPKTLSAETHENVAAVLPYIRQKVKMWGVYILKAENFNDILIEYKDENDEKDKDKDDIDEEDKDEEDEDEESSDDESSDSESNDKNQKTIKKNRLSRFDCIATLFASAECTVAQDIFRTISQFPIAFPLLIPELDKAGKYKVMLPLFTGPIIKWETSNGIVENHLFKDPFKMIVAVRIGTSPKGKTTIINQLMSSNYMFTSCNEPGADYGIPHMVSGSIEFVWLTEETCGSGFWNNVIKNYYEKKEKEILLLANLHGNALDYPDQIEFLKQFPSRFLVFLMPGYDKTQKDKFKALIDEDKAKYIYVNPKKKGKNEANKIYTDKLIESKEIKKVYEMFKNILETNFVGSTIVANGLKMGKSFQFAGSTEFLESKRIVDFIVKRKCYHIKMKVMQLQQKQKEEFKNKLDLNKNKSNPNKNKSIPIKIWKKSTELQELMRLFADILALPINKRRQALSHLEREVSRLSMEESSESRCDAIRKRKDLNNLGIKNEQEKGKSIRDDIAKLWQKVDDTSLGIEHFFRELGHIYDIFSSESDDSKIIFANGPTKEKILKLPEYYADLLINGNTIELLDGDSMTIYESWFLAICKCINKRFPKLRIFVISIIGLQSSGKSTLLNALFACKFAVSVGRCTKGLFMRLLFLEKDLSDHLEVDAFILIDTEGLGAPEKMGESDSEKKDRRLATFAMGISNLTIINVLGESMKELTEILQIAIVTMTRLEKAGMSPDIIMVQHVPEKNELKLSEPEQRFREALRKALETVEKRDGEVGAQNLDCLGILDERIKSGKLLKLFAPFKDGATAYSQPSKKYHEDIVELYNSIISDCKKSKSKKNFLDWSNLITCYWDAVDHEDFAVQFKNLNEMYEFFKLKKQVANLKGIINKAFAKHKDLIKKCILKQCKHQKQSNEDSIDPIRKECQQLIKKIYDVSEFTKEECCKECKEVIEERGKLDKDLEDKKNEKSREETNQTIEKYIYQCRDSIYIELKQMADAILMRNKLSNTHHKFIDEQLEKVLKSHNELSDEKDREREAENIWKSLREKIKSENKDSTINVNVKIDKEVTEGYEHRGSKQFRNMYSANTFPNLSMINKYEASFVNNFLNSTPLQPNELISIQTQIGNTVDEVLSDIDCFRDGIVGDLILKIDEKLSTSGRKYKPGSKQIIHAYALHYFKERMNKIQDEWNKNNTPVGVLDQKEDEYLKKILTRLQYGRSHQSEGLIAGDYLLRAIQKKAIDTENTDRINYVLDKEDWVKDSERVRTKYFIELADKVHNNDKDKGVQHFLKPRESIEKWFKDKVNSVTREDQGKIYEKTFNTEFKYVRQSILNCNGYDDIKEFVDDYMSDNDIDYELNTEDDTIAQQNFNIVQDAIIKELDDGKRNGRYQLKDNLLLNPSESKDVMEKLGCTEPCFWCGALCCEPRGHVEGYGKWKIHRTNHQPRGLSGTHDMNSKELRTKACHDVSDDANMHYHEKIKKWKIAISEDFNDWEFKPLKYSDDLSVLMRWFFHELHEKLAESHNLKAANESDLNSDCKLDKDYNKIICALKTKLDQ